MTGTVVFLAAVGLYTALAAVLDMRTHRIPNYLTVPAALLGLAYHTISPSGMGPWASLGGFGIGFGLLLVPWLLGGGGMGDVKLLAALGAWLGPVLMLAAFAVSMVLGAVLAACSLLNSLATRGVSKTGRRFLSSRRPLNKQGKRRPARVLPFAVPVALGTWMILAWMLTCGRL